MKFAYADPPYPGQAKRHYSDQALCQEVNHELLIGTLMDQAPDGWALSTSTNALRAILPMCPEKTRVLAWVKPFCAWRPRYPQYAWEPILMYGGRQSGYHGSDIPTRDWIAVDPPRFRGRGGFVGEKPPEMCFWLFDCLGVLPGDEMWDVFPGSGVVGRAFDAYTKKAMHHADLPLLSSNNG